jgi:hypothetical protein
LIRYRVREAAAQVARHAGDKITEIACRRKAVATAADLRRALIVAYEAGVLPWTDILELFWRSHQAEIALVEITADDPANAKMARAAVLGELMELADAVYRERQTLYKLGLTSWPDVQLAQVERSRIAVHLAREQGDREEELRAVCRVVDAQSSRYRRFLLLRENNVDFVASREFETVEWEFKVAQAQLVEVRARHEAGDASGEHKRLALVKIHTARCMKLEAEVQRARRDLAARKTAYQQGVCDALVVVDAAARHRLAELSLGQCRLDLEQLQQHLGNAP